MAAEPLAAAYDPPAVDLATLPDRYLSALGVPAAPPSAAGLVALHRAHVQRFAHDTVWMSRDRQPPVDDVVMAEHLLAGEGGACTHLNWAFSWLLSHLGYDVTRHRALSQNVFETEPHDRDGGHLVLSVQLDGERWYADVGLGNGILEPFPLRAGTVTQEGGFTYALERLADVPHGWRFLHDRRLRAITVVQFTEQPAVPEEVEDVYARASLRPDSPFVRSLAANRRLEDGVLMLAGTTLVHRRLEGRTVTRLEDAAEWEATLRERFLLGLPEWTRAERDRLWAKASA